MVSWIGSKGVGRGWVCLSREKDVSAQSTQVNLNQWLNDDRSKEQPLLAIKRKMKKLFLYSQLCSPLL